MQLVLIKSVHSVESETSAAHLDPVPDLHVHAEYHIIIQDYIGNYNNIINSNEEQLIWRRKLPDVVVMSTTTRKMQNMKIFILNNL